MRENTFIITGAGASGLLLAYAIANDTYFDDYQILIIDKEIKNKNDRTWCFWEKEANDFEHLLMHSWQNLQIGGKHTFMQIPTAPYTYKMLQSKPFYKAIMNTITAKTNMTFIEDTIVAVNDKDTYVEVVTNKATYEGAKVFSSLLKSDEITKTTKPLLWQHFKGWYIKTENKEFDSDAATFMDFSIPQEGNTCFMYVLPISATEALVEYTLFSDELLEDKAYDKALENYLTTLDIANYTVTETEKGKIPMTTHNFYTKNTKNVLHIGTSGGFTKPSTGYTFKSMQKRIPLIIEAIKNNTSLDTLFSTNRFTSYDTILLELLAKENHLGSEIFISLFENNPIASILKFLDEDTSHAEELAIINTLPKKPFLKAFKRIL
ncbi:lycopene cyclase [Neptunitalea chrysea]|uniref:Lycopene cyclase n=1 Tax=Neptunitalea chrysea TaxID=1647581 RepID=A0A9W6EVJ1_9FLAO|nr:lycopene cyclase family protein [Neptunitalea chrysea]GLB52567.1 lycopene cyclase [Neptunitalea chrysea]